MRDSLVMKCGLSTVSMARANFRRVHARIADVSRANQKMIKSSTHGCQVVVDSGKVQAFSTRKLSRQQWRLLAVEGTQPSIVPRPGLQLDVVADDADDAGLLLDCGRVIATVGRGGRLHSGTV